MPKEALLYHTQDDGSVQCLLCAHRCQIADGRTGVCGVRQNQHGTLYALTYDNVIATHVDPIEKKPLYHFLPGTLSFSIATVGCNFRCANCQNYDISQYPKEHPNAPLPGKAASPEDIVKSALQRGAASIAYTYTEPTIYFELAYETAKLAHENGIKNIFITNGYMTQDALEMIAPYLDAADVDLKGFNDENYWQLCGGHVAPVQDTIQRMHALNIWVEVTTLIIPQHNDSEDELRRLAEWMCSVDPGIPWHVSAFYPQYKMMQTPPTSEASIFQAVEIGKQAGLRYVYSGNVHSSAFEDTCCYICGKRLIHRRGFSVRENLITAGKCPACQSPIDGIF